MRLIDADALIETIRKYGVYGSGFGDAERENDVIDTIESQPTIEAVPVENIKRIVDRLEEASFWTEQTFDEDGYGNDDSWEAVWLDKAIEIVKEEGVI